jgi:integrase
MKKYFLLSTDFKNLIDFFVNTERLRGIKESTIKTFSSSTANFLYTLQQLGINSVGKITEKAFLSSISPKNHISTSKYWILRVLRKVFEVNKQNNPQYIEKILSFMPKIKYYKKNIQYITSNEIQSIKYILKNNNSNLTFRDRAIGILALYTGLRCCDITGLTLSDIDWYNERINISQQKTGFTFDLPLTITVGNAIFDYLAKERPNTSSDFLFVSNRKPLLRLTTSCLYNISVKIFKAANIRQNDGDRKGFHIFRHWFATALLGQGIAQPMISELLGHTSPESIEPYLSANFNSLKDCALSVERFPVPEDIFDNV